MQPIVERIAEKVFTRLQGLVSSPNVAVTEIYRDKRLEDYAPKHNQVMMRMLSPVKNAALSCPGNPPAVAWDQTFNIHWLILPNPKDPTPLDTFRNYVFAEVNKVICAPSSWHNWDGLAINSVWEDPAIVDDGTVFAAISVPLVVTFRVSEINSFERR